MSDPTDSTPLLSVPSSSTTPASASSSAPPPPPPPPAPEQDVEAEDDFADLPADVLSASAEDVRLQARLVENDIKVRLLSPALAIPAVAVLECGGDGRADEGSARGTGRGTRAAHRPQAGPALPAARPVGLQPRPAAVRPQSQHDQHLRARLLEPTPGCRPAAAAAPPSPTVRQKPSADARRCCSPPCPAPSPSPLLATPSPLRIPLDPLPPFRQPSGGHQPQVMRSELLRLQHDKAQMAEQIADNRTKIKQNRVLPYLVGNVVEVRLFGLRCLR